MFLLAACAPPVPDSGCVVDGGVACAHDTLEIFDGFSTRAVYHAAPEGEGPFPVAIGFQGSLFSADTFWRAPEGDLMGADHQVETTQALLDAGFIVATPETGLWGTTWWNTNVPPWAGDWEASPDHALMLALFDAIDNGELGPASGAMYAFGISSGGYMTSRMTAYPGRFDALVIMAASWATCGGALCFLPDALPDPHPPTRFMHGEGDVVVPIGTSELYSDALEDAGVVVDRVTHDGGHVWPEDSADQVSGWLLDH